MEQAIGGLYQLLDRAAPMIVWCESPWQIMAMYAVLDKQVGREWINKLPKLSAPEPRGSIEFEQLWHKLWIQIDAQIPTDRRFNLVEQKSVEIKEEAPNPLSVFLNLATGRVDPLLMRAVSGHRGRAPVEGFRASLAFMRLKLQKELTGVCHVRYGDDPSYAEVTRQYTAMLDYGAGDGSATDGTVEGFRHERIARQMNMDLMLFGQLGFDLEHFPELSREDVLNLGVEVLKGNLKREIDRISKHDQVQLLQFGFALMAGRSMQLPLALENLPLFEYLCEMMPDFPIGPSNRKRLELFVQAEKQSRNCLLLDKVAFVSERPRVLKLDERGRLHSDSGPAIAFGDGYRIYSWHGTTVPANLIDNPAVMTVGLILYETNAEVRRVMIERFGVSKFIAAANAKKVHEDECGILYRLELRDDEPLVMVKVLNTTPEPDGTRKEYFLRVPPSIQTAREAVAWTFDMSAAEYSPQRQT